LGEASPKDQKATVTPGLIDRFDAVLDVGRRIAAALSREAVHNAIGEAALTLLRAEVCLVLGVANTAVGGKRRVQVLATFGPSSDAAYSRTLVDRAVDTGRPVVSGDGTERDASESVVLSGARSILCAPVAVRGGIAACFYVTHRQVGGLFGPDEERLAEFVATLAGAALENVEGLAKSESQLIANSAAGLAHAIKNPVAIIRAYVDLLRTSISSGDSSAFSRYLTTMDGALDRINELVRRLRRVPVDGCRKGRVVLESLVRRAVDEVRPLFSEGSGYRIDIHVSPEAPRTLVADGEQVILALANVLANAGQSMPEGGLIRVDVRSEDRGSAMIAVSDQGPGISPEVHQRLFEPFLTTKPEGTGLGLWVCRKIVEVHHQGRITVAPAPGGGTTVVLALPFGDGAGPSRDNGSSLE
jgi:signal transduction histidine kinase